jgi:hypothetical protein
MKTSLFLILSLLYSVVIIILVATLNVVVNPYEILTIERFSFNQFKPEAGNRVRTFKKYRPAAFNPDTLLMGNSRVEIGFNPSSPQLKAIGSKIYNLGVPGASFLKQIAYANRVIEKGHVKTVLFGVDFIDFLYSKKNPSIQQFPSNITGKNKIIEYAEAIFSLDGAISSVKTLFNQQYNNSTREYNGFNPARNYLPIIQHEGVSVLFQQKTTELMARFKKNTFSSDSPITLLRMDALTKFLAQCKEKGIKVYLFINPYHARYYRAIDKSGLSDSFNSWQIDLAKIAEQNSRLTFRNFTHFGNYDQEVVPGLGIKGKPLKWYWEPAHYRQELGDKMLESLLRQEK